MEVAVGLFSAIGSAASAVVGGGAAAASSAGSWLAGTTAVNAAGATVFSGASSLASSALASLGSASFLTSTALSVLQGVSTLGAIDADMAAGKAAVQEADMQASATALQARDQALRIREEELEKIGQARVGFAASGVDLSSAAAVESQIRSDSKFERQLTRTTGRISEGQIRLRGRNSMLASSADAGGKAANFLIDLARRG